MQCSLYEKGFFTLFLDGECFMVGQRNEVGLIILRLSGVFTSAGRDNIHVDHAGSISSSGKCESLVAADIAPAIFNPCVWKYRLLEVDYKNKAKVLTITL